MYITFSMLHSIPLTYKHTLNIYHIVFGIYGNCYRLDNNIILTVLYYHSFLTKSFNRKYFYKLLVHGSKHSLYGSEQSLYGSEQSLYGSEQSLYGSEQSLYGSEHSLYGSEQSLYGSEQSLYGSEQSLYGSEQSLNES